MIRNEFDYLSFTLLKKYSLIVHYSLYNLYHGFNISDKTIYNNGKAYIKGIRTKAITVKKKVYTDFNRGAHRKGFTISSNEVSITFSYK